MYCHHYIVKRKVGIGAWSQIASLDTLHLSHVDDSINLNNLTENVFYRVYGEIYDNLSHSAPEVAYYAPANVSISGPTSLGSGQSGQFTANVLGGEPPYSFEWYKFQWCDDLKGQQPDGVPCGYWQKLTSTAQTITASGVPPEFTLKVILTANNGTDDDLHDVEVTGGQ